MHACNKRFVSKILIKKRSDMTVCASACIYTYKSMLHALIWDNYYVHMGDVYVMRLFKIFFGSIRRAICTFVIEVMHIHSYMLLILILKHKVSRISTTDKMHSARNLFLTARSFNGFIFSVAWIIVIIITNAYAYKYICNCTVICTMHNRWRWDMSTREMHRSFFSLVLLYTEGIKE